MLSGSPVAGLPLTASLGAGGLASTFPASTVNELHSTVTLPNSFPNGYTRASQAAPVPVAGVASFTQMTWQTGAATDWPANAASIILVSSQDNSGKLICAWNLIASGAARDMSQPNTTEQVTPTLTTSS